MSHGEPNAPVDLFLRWLRVEKGRATNTVESYARDLSRYQSWLRQRGIDLESVSTDDVAGFVNDLVASGEAASTTARRLAAVRMLHSFLHHEGLSAENPAALAEGIRVPQGIPKPLGHEEVERLLDGASRTDPPGLRDRAVLEFLYATGARISEACDLQMHDLDLRENLVRLFGKGAKERVVPFGSVAAERIASYLSDGRPSLAGPGARSREDREAVFLTNRGRRLSRQAAWKIVRSAGESVGLPRTLSPHVLRHSCATHMLEHGADLRIVQEMLGHASISTTQIYTRVSPEMMLAVYREHHPRARRT